MLFAHPSIERSEVNVELLAAAQQVPGVTVVELYREYCTLQIDIDREQQRLLEHDVIVFMFPMYWYSTPPLLKEWQDLVLEYGFAYGADGAALARQDLSLRAYRWRPAEAPIASRATTSARCANCCVRWSRQPIFAACGTGAVCPVWLTHRGGRGRTALPCRDWRLVLEALRDDQLDLQRSMGLPMLNGHLPA